MFVASTLYSYATGSNAPAGGAGTEATDPNTRVKRRPNRSNRKGKGSTVPSAAPSSSGTLPSSPPPSYASVADVKDASAAALRQSTAAEVVADAAETAERSAADKAKMQVVDDIIAEQDLYAVLGVKRNAKPEEIRRGFLARSRVCHPDKFPSYPPCISAFQRVSLAYQTLSSPSSRRMYDVSGRADFAAAVQDGMPPGSASDETLNGVLYSVFCEFLDGDFEMIRVLVNAMNEGSPGLALGDDAVDSIEGAFQRLRGMMLAGKKYLGIIRFELIRLYEIQQSLRQLSYFDVFGRLRLTLQLARVTLSIPMAIDSAMKDPSSESCEEGAEGEGTAGAEASGSAPPTRAAAAADGDYSTESSDSEEDEEIAAKARQAAANADFGVAAEEPTDDSDAEEDVVRHRGDARSRRRDRKRARRRSRRRVATGDAAGDDAEDGQENGERRNRGALQRKGLLGPTAAALLGGVVKVLETSESWVPGSRVASEEP